MGFQRSTYYDAHNRQTPALIRARRPYLVKNAVTGLAISALAVGIYIYTIRAVGQDDFEDVKVPDVPLQPAAAAAGAQTAKKEKV